MSNALKHTPGPWTIDFDVQYAINDNKNRHVTMVNSYKTIKGDEEENIANAQLIASAPELLEACEYALRWHSGDKWRSGTKSEQKSWNVFNNILKQAIRKAKGGE